MVQSLSYQFESCAAANLWTEKTKAVQLRFSLTGAAGAVIHKNPRSAQWDDQRIIQEMEAAYGPSSEHAAAIGIELRQRVRRPGEVLHALRDDIYEKVSIVYADRSELEQEATAVEIFINSLADADAVQKLLEEKPRTLAKAYDVARRYEATRQAARVVTQLMLTGSPGSTRQRARAVTVQGTANPMAREQSEEAMIRPADTAGGAPSPSKQVRPRKGPVNRVGREDVICHNCSGVGHLQRDCPSPRQARQFPSALTPPNVSIQSLEPETVVAYAKTPQDEMGVQILIQGRDVWALLDSGAARNVLPLRHYNSIPLESRPPVQPSGVQTLQGITPGGLAVLGEVVLPVQVGTRVTSVNFIVAATAGNAEVILGQPFLQQAGTCLDYGRREITLFGEKVAPYNPNRHPEVHLVRVAGTIVLESGCEYVVPGTARFHRTAERVMMLSPTKGFIEKHCVLVARAVVQPGQTQRVPIRVYNPGTLPVTLKGGTPAAILRPAEVLGGKQLQSQWAPGETNPNNCVPVSVPSHLQALYTESGANLSEEERGRLAHLLRSHGDVFFTGPHDLGRTNFVQHDILTTPGPPIKQQPRRMARDKQIAADSQVRQSLEAGLARTSNSGWAAPIVMVGKKDQTLRLCVDYRPLNDRTIKDAYPLPRIQDTLDTLSTAKYFSTLDLTSGYWQVEMTPRARKAAAFCTRKGLFEWNVMPFGLCNAPATFQRLMDRVLVGLQWEMCLVYLDDIIVLGRDVAQMLQRLDKVFTRLREANLKLKPSKCCLFKEEVAYLGHVVSARGVATDPQKVQKVADWPTPKNVSEVRQFVGLASYYR